MGINAKGTFLTLRAAALHVAKGGGIVAVSSSTVDHPKPGMAAYAESKAVVRTWVQVPAQELGSRGITVNVVSPGPTIPGVFAFANETARARAAIASPLDRIGRPEDTAEVVAFPASAAGRWLTGCHLLANGGATV